jgi:quercetin dioxygenase-like cupin family protein
MAPMSAILQFLQGEATVTLGNDKHEEKPGTWVHMSTDLRHSIQPRTPMLMLLLLKEPHP